MKVDLIDSQRALLQLDTYQDLLRIRQLPEWRFVSADSIETDPAHLYSIGLVDDIAPVNWGTPAPHLFDYQRWVLQRALNIERFAAFLTTGLGKTAIQLEWARLVHDATQQRVLIVAPLNIVPQTLDEHRKFYDHTWMFHDLREPAALRRWLETGKGIGVTNYEKLDAVDEPLPVGGVVLDESSILKNTNGKRRAALNKAFRGVRYKLACSATPAPNDRVEYAEHAYWLEVVRSTREFLAGFFVNRDGDWVLKRHGLSAFYRHLASWSVFMLDPSEYRFHDVDTSLPPLEVSYPSVTLTDEQTRYARLYETGDQPSLFGATPGGIVSRTKMMQISNGFLLDHGDIQRFSSLKPAAVADLVNDRHAGEQIIVWVHFDEEGEHLASLIPDARHVYGRTPTPERERLIEQFRLGVGPRVLILKPSMFGFGLNFQRCRVQVFSSMSDSFERWYQSVRRSWRFGQSQPVLVYVPVTELDRAMVENTMNKQAVFHEDATRQQAAYVEVLRPRDTTERIIQMPDLQTELARVEGDTWTMIHGDCIAHMEHMDEHSMDLAVFSPPFANLFTYSAELADMGNVKSDAEYRLQWQWFAERLLHVMKPGRVVAVHCMDIIRFAGQYGVRHTYDYPADLRAGMEDAGFLYRARISIDKNPQIQATRTKDQNLLFATLKRNALDSHPQAGEYVLVFTAPGDADVPVVADDVSNQEWIQWAHHIWYGIRETDVLNAALAADQEDERHICPLQLSLIERCVRLWSNEGETVFSPFAGMGSEGWEALAWRRRFYGVELKEKYFETACRLLAERAQSLGDRLDLDYGT